MTGIPYNTILTGVVGNRHRGTVDVVRPTAHRTPMREETWIGNRLDRVDYYNDIRMVNRVATIETMKVDITFPDGTWLRTEGRDLRNGDEVLFTRHRGAGGDVDDVFDVQRRSWHFVGTDRTPPVSRVSMAIGGAAGALGIHISGGDLQEMVRWAAFGAVAAFALGRLRVAYRKVDLHLRRKRAEREMGRMLARR